MLIQIISHYLATNKRLVVPQLGAFIVKIPGESVIFSELLKRDDGVLRGLLAAEGVGELEAAGMIDRFVFEVRHAIEQQSFYEMNDFGTLRIGGSGALIFTYNPVAVPSVPADLKTAPVTIREPKVSISAKIAPEPYVRGLQYEKPIKGEYTYTYVKRRGPVDKFMLFALIAVVLAVMVIAYGYFREKGESVSEQKTEQEAAPVDSVQMRGVPAEQ